MSIRRLAFAQSLHDMKRERTKLPSVYVVAGRYDLTAIMQRAVIVARTMKAGGKPWSWRMGIALRTVWGWAKRQMGEGVTVSVIPSRQVSQPGKNSDTRKLALDRGQAIALLARIQNCAPNRDRDILTVTGTMRALDEVLQHARAEFRHLSERDRARVMAPLTGAAS